MTESLRDDSAEVAASNMQPERAQAAPLPRARFAWLWSAAPVSAKERWLWACSACLLCAPALFSGLIVDDFFVLHQVRGEPLLWGLLHAFDFTSDVPDFESGLELGVWPWWTDAHAKLRFFRPLAALTHALDARLLHDLPWIMHAESLLILLALTLAALRWFQALFPEAPRVARVSGVLYALSPGHALNGSWLSARNALLASLFATLALLAHHRARQRRHGGLLALSSLCVALSLLSGEMGASALALLLSHACFLDRAPWRERLLWLSPALVLAAGWLLLYVNGRYGVQSSPIYLSPFQQPLDYLTSAAVRFPILVLGSFGLPIIAFVILMSSTAQLALASLGIALLAWLAPRFAALVRVDARARFCAAAFCTCALPALGTLPHERLLMVAELGALPLLVLALLLAPRRAAASQLERALLASRVCLSVPLALAGSGSMWTWVKLQREPLEAALRPAEVQQRSVFFVNVPIVLYTRFLPYQRAYQGQAGPGRVRVLAQAVYGLSVTRTDAQTLALRSRYGLLQALGSIRTDAGLEVPAISLGYGAQFLNHVSLPDPRMPAGTQIRLSDVTLTVAETTPEGWPRELRARFHAPLESERFQFVQWKDDGWKPWPLPELGQTVKLEAVLK